MNVEPLGLTPNLPAFHDEAKSNVFHDDLSPVSSNSIKTSCSNEEISLSSEDFETEQVAEIESFVRRHVLNLFDPEIEISRKDKQRFGQLCQTPEGRGLFAKYINKQRCFVKQVDETTFYKLAHSFALVLFECSEFDDFSPSKTLMNMSFTFFHIPESNSIQPQIEDEIIELQSPDGDFLQNYYHDLSDESGNENEKLEKNQKNKFVFRKRKSSSRRKEKSSVSDSVNAWFKNEFVPFFQVSNRGFDKNRLSKSDQNISNSNVQKKGSSTILFTATSSQEKNQKVFLYEVLRRQPIWKSIRFWNAAFFDSLNSERKKHINNKNSWNSLSEEDRSAVNVAIQNATFGQLGTFINNMKCLGLGQKTCMEFLRKQSIIGNLDKDHYQVLKTQVELPLQVGM